MHIVNLALQTLQLRDMPRMSCTYNFQARKWTCSSNHGVCVSLCVQLFGVHWSDRLKSIDTFTETDKQYVFIIGLPPFDEVEDVAQGIEEYAKQHTMPTNHHVILFQEERAMFAFTKDPAGSPLLLRKRKSMDVSILQCPSLHNIVSILSPTMTIHQFGEFFNTVFGSYKLFHSTHGTMPMCIEMPNEFTVTEELLPLITSSSNVSQIGVGSSSRTLTFTVAVNDDEWRITVCGIRYPAIDLLNEKGLIVFYICF